MIVITEKEKWLEIYSDSNKKIHELPNDAYWNTNAESPIAVDKGRYANGEYIESDIECDVELVEEKAENNEL